MKFLFPLLLCSLAISINGCGGAAPNTAVTENADAKAIADYEADIKAQEEAENKAQSAK